MAPREDSQGLEMRREEVGGALWFRLGGALDVHHAQRLYEALEATGPERHVVIDITHLGVLDSAGIAVLSLEVGRFREGGGGLSIFGVTPDHRLALEMMPARPEHVISGPEKAGFVEGVGASAFSWMASAREFGELCLGTFQEFIRVITFQAKLPKGAVLEQVVRLGIDSLPIIAMLSFLLGLIMGFEGAYQFEQFGASIYVANLVGTAISREFGPLMAGIILSGRSGAAIAAELGTMKVSEEIDALRVMGLDPTRYLVLPRVLALLLSGPALTLIGILLGLLGGLLIAVSYLDISASAYWVRTQASVGDGDLIQGLAKSYVFALIVGLLGCYQGLYIKGGASSVGLATMRAVVASIFMIIVADAFFTASTAVFAGG